MSFIKTKKTAIESWFHQRSARLNSKRSLACAMVFVPCFFGMLSLFLGQDSNWDMLNYHFYNAYALLHGKLGIDLAPAQMQSYFNPALDIPYFLMTKYWPAPLTGFVMGAVHGLNFVLLVVIARAALPDIANDDRYRVPLLLALAGCVGAGFLSEVGNTMGDNLTALFVLASLALLLLGQPRFQQWGLQAALYVLLAGLVMGVGAGLKLTNSVYAVALCLAFLSISIEFWSRIRLAFVFGVGVLTGLSISAGFWFLEMWNRFGNPLFPQFNNIFHGAMASPLGISDTRWLPKGLGEALLWPIIFTLDPKRVGEVPLRQIIWPIMYCLFFLFAIQALRTRRLSQSPLTLNNKSRFLITFFGVAFVVWMLLFSIYRYLIPLELVAPLIAWIILNRLLSDAHVARKVAGYILTLSVVAVFPFSTWGHSAWSSKSFTATVPHIENPAATTVIVVGGPLAWLIPFFPNEVAFTSIAGSFPESEKYIETIHSMISHRAGTSYVLIEAHTNFREELIRKENALVDWVGMNTTGKGCAALHSITNRIRLHAQVKVLPPNDSPRRCELELAQEDRVDLVEENRMQIRQSEQILNRYGFKLNADTCKAYSAFVGNTPRPYQLCKLR